jgi:hypothetical protein
MSEHAHGGASEVHADHHNVYEGKPADEPGPGEPATPGWLTLLGITLVLAAMLGYVATRPDGKTRAELTPAGATTTTAAPAPVLAAANPSARPVRPMPSGLRPGMFPSARPPGNFALIPGSPGGGAAPPRRRPVPSDAQ